MKKKIKIVSTLVVIIGTLILVSGCGDKIEKVTDYALSIDTVYGKADGLYTGELTNGEVTGKGKFEFVYDETENWELTYEGEFSQGKFMGEGQLSGKSTYTEAAPETTIEGDFNGLDRIVGVKKVNGKKVFEGELSQFRYSWIGISQFIIDDLVYDGEGTIFNSNEEAIYKGKFIKQKPEDEIGFKEACRETSLFDLQKNAGKSKGDLIKLNCKSPYFDSVMWNNNFFIFQFGDDTDISVTGIYQYNESEERFVDGEEVVLYGIVMGYLNDSPMIEVLAIEDEE